MSGTCREVAVVTGTRPKGQVEIKVRRAEACHSCAAKGACTVLGGSAEDLVLVLEDRIGLNVGDHVILTLDEASVIKASAVLYLVPALGLIAGAVAGWLTRAGGTDRGELATAVGSFVGLGLGLITTKLLGDRMSRKARYIPRLEKIEG